MPFCYVCNLFVEDKASHECPVAKELLENPTEVHWTAADSITDTFRKAYLSEKSRKNLSEQNRGFDPLAPRDKAEAKEIQARTGRNYFGHNIDNVSMTPEIRKQYGY